MVSTLTYVYTPRGTLESATSSGGALALTQSDAFGQVASQDSPSGSTTQTYTYDALGRVVRSGAPYSGIGNTLAADGSTLYTRTPDGILVGVAQSSTKRIAWTDEHTDLVGQFVAGTGTTTLDAGATFDPFGQTLATTGSPLGSLGYQSEYTDTTTGKEPGSWCTTSACAVLNAQSQTSYPIQVGYVEAPDGTLYVPVRPKPNVDKTVLDAAYFVENNGQCPPNTTAAECTSALGEFVTSAEINLKAAQASGDAGDIEKRQAIFDATVTAALVSVYLCGAASCVPGSGVTTTPPDDKSTWQDIKDFGNKVENGIKDAGSWAWGGIKDAGSWAWGGIKDAGSWTWDAIKSGTREYWHQTRFLLNLDATVIGLVLAKRYGMRCEFKAQEEMLITERKLAPRRSAAISTPSLAGRGFSRSMA